MNLYQQTHQVWESGNCTATVDRWAETLESCLEDVHLRRNDFRQWDRLNVYLSYSMATARTPTFSLRFLGQEVGKILSRNGKDNTRLRVTKHHEESTRNAFGIDFVARTCDWKSEDASKFRESFRDPKKMGPHSPEHWIESRFLEEMRTKDRSKFCGTLKNIQPVLLHGCPFQCPVPIGASEGRPKQSPRANIDILARGAGRRLAVWELKRPGITAHSLDQVYIYAVTLAKMLRSNHGDKWFRFFGFNGPVPKSLELDAVVAVTTDQQNAIKNRIERFSSPLELEAEQTKIRLFAAYYDWNPGSEELKIQSRVRL